MNKRTRLKSPNATTRCFILAVMAICLCADLPAAAGDAPIAEYRIKVAFFYNFLKFVDWPGEDSPRKTSKANVCITGDSKFAEYLRTLQDNKKQPLTITVNSLATDSNTASCHILLIGKTEEEHIVSILAHTRHHPVLSISEASNFADNGGIIEIVRTDKSIGLFSQDKINLRINLKAAQSSGLNIDARLLQIAAEVIK